MEAPKEIYIQTCYLQDIEEEGFDAIWTVVPLPEEGNIKYIRADIAELTWEDIKRINELMVETANKFNHLEVFTEKFFVEVLRRFNELKSK